MNTLISVIVPVYNAEKTIERCAKSIVAQTDKNFEVLFVNDGSTDKSKELLNKICASRGNFKLFTTKNGGAAAARNFGIDKANGDYICFVDADDIVSPNYIKTLRQLISENSADVACIKYARNKIDYFEKITDVKSIISGNEAIDALLRMEIANGPVAKIYTKEVIGRVRMPDVAVAEDLYFNYLVFKHAKKVVLNDSVAYSYIEARGSLSNSFSIDRMKSLDIVQKIDAMEHSFYSGARVFMEAYFICERMIISGKNKVYKNEYKKLCSILAKERKTILNDERSTKRQRLIATALKLGPVFTAKLMTAKSRIKRKAN